MRVTRTPSSQGRAQRGARGPRGLTLGGCSLPSAGPPPAGVPAWPGSATAEPQVEPSSPACVPGPGSGCPCRPRRIHPAAAPTGGRCLPAAPRPSTAEGGARAPGGPSAPTGMGWPDTLSDTNSSCVLPGRAPREGTQRVRRGCSRQTRDLSPWLSPPHRHHGCLPPAPPSTAWLVPKPNAPPGLGGHSWSNSGRHFVPLLGCA